MRRSPSGGLDGTPESLAAACAAVAVRSLCSRDALQPLAAAEASRGPQTALAAATPEPRVSPEGAASLPLPQLAGARVRVL